MRILVNSPRFGVSTIMLIVLACALGLSALRSASPWWESALVLGTLALLSGAALMAVARRGPPRMAWLGCAIFGWAHLVICVLPGPRDPAGTLRAAAVLDEMIPLINPRLDAEIRRFPPPGGIESIGYSRVSVNTNGLLAYRKVGGLIMTLMLALLGASLGRMASRPGRSSGRHGGESFGDASPHAPRNTGSSPAPAA